MGNLKERLETAAQQEGAVALSSQDMAAFGRGDAKPPEEVLGTVTADVPPEAKKDTMLAASAPGSTGERLADLAQQTLPEDTEVSAKTLAASDTTTALTEVIELTEADRKAFLDAVIRGTRFVLPFSLFGGNVRGKFRSRSLRESSAILAQLNREIRNEELPTVAQYSTRLRNVLLAAQVLELQDETYPELNEPLMATVQNTGVTPPGWLGNVEVWEKKNEGLVTAIYDELRTFEKKYWTMVAKARDQDFWAPAGSTSA